MQAELQGWDVAPGHGGYTGAQGPPRLMSKIGSEEKLGRWLSTVCPVSVAIRLAIWQPRPGNRDVSGTATIGRKDGWPPELRQRQGVQSTGPPARGLAGQYRREPGDAAAAGQRRLEHLRRSPHGADRGDPPDPLPHARAAAGPRRRGRRQPRADHPSALAVVPVPHRAVHLRLGHHPVRRAGDRATARRRLAGRAAGWPAGLRWIVRRTRPSRRQAKNLTAFERATGWRYSIIVTNIPDTGIKDVPGSHHAQFTGVLHRQHAIVEDGVRAGKSMGLRNLPSKTWTVNCGWVLAANLAADLAAWCRLLGLYDQQDLKDAEPDTLRYRLLSLPARLVRHARARVLKISR